MTRRKKKWFGPAVAARPPYTLGGWSKDQSVSVRRRLALASRPKSWSMKRRYLSAARALQALANVTKDMLTKRTAKVDAEYFFSMYAWKRIYGRRRMPR